MSHSAVNNIFSWHSFDFMQFFDYIASVVIVHPSVVMQVLCAYNIIQHLFLQAFCRVAYCCCAVFQVAYYLCDLSCCVLYLSVLGLLIPCYVLSNASFFLVLLALQLLSCILYCQILRSVALSLSYGR